MGKEAGQAHGLIEDGAGASRVWELGRASSGSPGLGAQLPGMATPDASNRRASEGLPGLMVASAQHCSPRSCPCQVCCPHSPFVILLLHLPMASRHWGSSCLGTVKYLCQSLGFVQTHRTVMSAQVTGRPCQMRYRAQDSHPG